MVSKYSRLPFKLKVDYFILYWILVSTFVIFLPFFPMNKRCTDKFENSSFIQMCTCQFKRKQNWKTDYQHVISCKKSSGHHISVSIKGTFWYLSLFFLEWSPFSYFSCYVSLGFTIRSVTTQNNHQGFEFSSFFQTCLPVYDSFLAQLTRAVINFCIWQQAKLMLKRVNGQVIQLMPVGKKYQWLEIL